VGSKLALRAQIALASLALAAIAHADPKKDAQDHIAQSASLFQSGKYADALDQLLQAYSLDPQPGLLYSIGQVHVKLGLCDRAITWYQKFIDTNPAEKPKQAAKEAISSCEKTLKSQPKPPEPTITEPKPPEPTVTEPKPPEPAPAPAPAPAPMPTPGPAPETPPTTSSSSWYSDPIFDALAIGGVAGCVVGGIYYSKAHSDYDSAEHATDYTTHHSLIDSGQSAQTLSIVASAAGGALLVGAVVRYVVSDRGSEPSSTVSVGPTAHGAAITWSGRW
jgi:tetratricopeptide (TPR) repeat protein